MNLVTRYGSTAKKLAWKSKDRLPTLEDTLREHARRAAQALQQQFEGTYSKKSEDLYEVTALIELFNPDFNTLVTFRIDIAARELAVISTIVSNNKPLRVDSKALLIQLFRFFNRLNVSIRYGHFNIHPLTHAISLKLSTIFTQKQFVETLSDLNRSKQYLREELKSTYEYLRYNFYKILQLAGHLPPDAYKFLRFRNYDFRDANPLAQNHLDRLQRIVSVSNVQFEFMFMDAIKRMTKLSSDRTEQIRVESEETITRMAKLSRQDPVLNEYIGIFTDLKKVQSAKMEMFSRQRINNFMKALIIQHPRNPSDGGYVFQKIVVVNTCSSWVQVVPGDITRQYNSIEFHNTPPAEADLEALKVKNSQEILNRNQRRFNEPPTRKQIIKKTVCKITGEKVEHEKRILMNMILEMSHYINTYFYSTAQVYKNCILAEFFPHMTLNNYIDNNRLCCSLMTKLYLLMSGCQGLRFSHDYGIFHLRVKPDSFSLGGGFFLRLGEFCEAYHKKSCE